jgi:predicted enzyme related to lactoylglutathione lyase
MTSRFIWYELMTTDADAAARFYGTVLGWTVRPGVEPGMDYRMIVAPDDQGIGGILQLTDDMKAHGARPVWLGYLAVPDVDAAVKEIAAQGGTIQMPPMTVHAGRLAMVTDPQGAPFYVMTPTPPADQQDAASTAFSRTAVGHCAWNELATSDPQGALQFYTRQFGFADGGSMPMDNAGRYQFLNDADGMIGAITTSSGANRQPIWLYYFRVADIDAAAKNVAAGGGTVMHGPQEVPGGDYILVGSDPSGATFALVGARRT